MNALALIVAWCLVAVLVVAGLAFGSFGVRIAALVIFGAVFALAYAGAQNQN